MRLYHGSHSERARLVSMHPDDPCVYFAFDENLAKIFGKHVHSYDIEFEKILDLGDLQDELDLDEWERELALRGLPIQINSDNPEAWWSWQMVRPDFHYNTGTFDIRTPEGMFNSNLAQAARRMGFDGIVLYEGHLKYRDDGSVKRGRDGLDVRSLCSLLPPEGF